MSEEHLDPSTYHPSISAEPQPVSATRRDGVHRIVRRYNRALQPPPDEWPSSPLGAPAKLQKIGFFREQVRVPARIPEAALRQHIDAITVSRER